VQVSNQPTPGHASVERTRGSARTSPAIYSGGMIRRDSVSPALRLSATALAYCIINLALSQSSKREGNLTEQCVWLNRSLPHALTGPGVDLRVTRPGNAATYTARRDCGTDLDRRLISQAWTTRAALTYLRGCASNPDRQVHQGPLSAHCFTVAARIRA
jgi:hypothetical protein